MKMETLSYKGFDGSVEFSLEDGVLHGKILFVVDLVTYEGRTLDELAAEFQHAVDDYLETCAACGKDPDKPFSGLFNVRAGHDLHRAASLRAVRDGVSLNAVVVKALESYLVGGQVQNHLHHHTHEVTVVAGDQGWISAAPGEMRVVSAQGSSYARQH